MKSLINTLIMNSLMIEVKMVKETNFFAQFQAQTTLAIADVSAERTCQKEIHLIHLGIAVYKRRSKNQYYNASNPSMWKDHKNYYFPLQHSNFVLFSVYTVPMYNG